MLSHTKSTLDLQRLMDRGEGVIVNLAGMGKAYERDSDMFGRLLIGKVLFTAPRRKTKIPFNLVIDEASRFLSNDIPELLASVRKRKVSVVAAMQHLQQAESLDKNILHALLNTGVKVSFRLRESEDAERMARDMVPIDIERPVRTLIKPTLMGHRIRHLANQSEQQQSSESEGETRVRTVGRAVTTAHTQGISIGELTSETEQESDTEQTSDGGGVVAGNGTTSSEIAIPTQDPSNPHVSRVMSGETAFTSESSNWTSGNSHTKGKARTSGTQITRNEGTTDAITSSESDAVGRISTKQRGRGSSVGTAETLESILEDRPSAVHSIQAQLYEGGLMLRSLPTAVGFCSFVGRRGPVATLFTVPPVLLGVSDEDKASNLARFIERSPSRLPMETAVEAMKAREQRVYGQEAPKRQPKKAQRPDDDTNTGSETGW